MTTRPESVGLSSERLRRLDALLDERYIAPGRLPCALTLVHRRGETAHLSVQGMADLERGKPLAEDSMFRIYSMSKPITTVALMMLFEEGRIQLDDPVHRYIPEWRDLGVFVGGGAGTPFRSRPVKRPMQVVDLLRHTSGLTYGFHQRTNIDAAYRAKDIGIMGGPLPLDDMIKELARVPLEFSPGDAWNYSVATDVVGYLIAKVSGRPFEDFLRERILAPLDMQDTAFFVPPEKQDRFTACYTVGRNAALTLQDDPETSGYLAPPAFYSGGGGLVSTAADYLTFCRMLLAGGALGNVRLLSPKTVELMAANHLPGGKSLTDMSVSMFSEAAYAGIGFGLGFSVTIDPAASLLPGSVGDMSWGGAASTYFWVDPKEELICIFMTQFMPSTFHNVRRELRTLVYSSILD